MSVREKLFPNQSQEERIFLLIRKHWFNYVIFFFLDFLAVIPVLIALFVWVNNPTLITPVGGQILVIFLAIFVLVVLAAQLYGFVDYYLDVYIVTDQRIVDISQEGYFKRQISELHLHQVQDVNARVEGIWQTLLHFGDVHIQTAGERENFVFKSIPHPYLVAKQIISLHEAHIERTNRRSNRRDVGLGERARDSEAELPFGELERQAKNVLGESRFIDRVKYGGMVITQEDRTEKDNIKKLAQNNKILVATDSNTKNDSKVNKKVSDSQGELTEGREIDLTP